MMTFEEEAQLREGQVPIAAEALFSRPLFKIPQFVVTTALGVGALVLDIRLDIAAWNETKPQCESSLSVAAVILVAAWFAVSSHLEGVRARYLNESGFSGEQRSALSKALDSAAARNLAPAHWISTLHDEFAMRGTISGLWASHRLTVNYYYVTSGLTTMHSQRPRRFRCPDWIGEMQPSSLAARDRHFVDGSLRIRNGRVHAVTS